MQNRLQTVCEGTGHGFNRKQREKMTVAVREFIKGEGLGWF